MILPNIESNPMRFSSARPLELRGSFSDLFFLMSLQIPLPRPETGSRVVASPCQFHAKTSRNRCVRRARPCRWRRRIGRTAGVCNPTYCSEWRYFHCIFTTVDFASSISEIGLTQPNPLPPGGTQKWFLLYNLFTLFTYFYVRSPENKFYSDRFLDSSGTRAHIFFRNPGFIRGQPHAH